MLLRHGCAHRAIGSDSLFSGECPQPQVQARRRRWEGLLVLGVLVAQSGLAVALRSALPSSMGVENRMQAPVLAGESDGIIEVIWDWLTKPSETPPPPPPPPPADGGGGW